MLVLNHINAIKHIKSHVKTHLNTRLNKFQRVQTCSSSVIAQSLALSTKGKSFLMISKIFEGQNVFEGQIFFFSIDFFFLFCRPSGKPSPQPDQNAYSESSQFVYLGILRILLMVIWVSFGCFTPRSVKPQIYHLSFYMEAALSFKLYMYTYCF